MTCVALKDRALVRIAGEDAETLLQDVISCDVDGLQAGLARQGALLTPQGKILFEFLISRSGDDGFLLDLRSETADGFIQRMTLYKLRAKATIEKVEGLTVYACWDGKPEEGSLVDERFVGDAPVYRAYGESCAETGTLEHYELLRIEAGVPEAVCDFELSSAFPHDVLMDLNNGISRDKGCYVGQEVVSRMQHRGTARRRVVQVSADCPLPASGSSIEAEGRPIGQLGTVVGNQALALVRTDRVAAALDKDQQISAGGVELRLTLPAWTGLQFPTQDRSVGETAS